jgi:hypothetical protein
MDIETLRKVQSFIFVTALWFGLIGLGAKSNLAAHIENPAFLDTYYFITHLSSAGFSAYAYFISQVLFMTGLCVAMILEAVIRKRRG